MNIAAPPQGGLLCSETLNHLEMMNTDTKQAKERLKQEIKNSGYTRKKWYRKVYLLSEHWNNLKIRLFFSLGEKRCCKCGFNKYIEVHHINYKNIYDVLLSDLEVLCRRCHKREHKKINKVKRAEKKVKLEQRRANRVTRSPKRLLKQFKEKYGNTNKNIP